MHFIIFLWDSDIVEYYEVHKNVELDKSQKYFDNIERFHIGERERYIYLSSYYESPYMWWEANMTMLHVLIKRGKTCVFLG